MDWKAFAHVVRRHRVPAKQVEWYVRWAQRFVKSIEGDLSAVKPGQVNLFLRDLLEKEGREAWQIDQAADSLRILVAKFGGPSWGKEWQKLVVVPYAPDHEVDSNGSAGQHVLALSAELFDSKVVAVEKDLLELVRNASRLRHYSPRTEQSYEGWVKRFLYNNQGRKLAKLGGAEVRGFLEYLAREKGVAASTQNQALNALVFFFDQVLGRPVGDIGAFALAKKTRRLPVVLSVIEVQRLFAELSGLNLLMAGLLYGSGLRLMECMRLRVMDVDFDRQELLVRNGKGKKDRVTILPQRFQQALQEHVARVKAGHDKELSLGNGNVYLPTALARKYPAASKEWSW